MITLYIDCLPVKGPPAQNLAEFAGRVCRALEAEYKVIDIRAAPRDNPLGFAAWKGYVSALVRREPIAPGAYCVLDTRSSEIHAVIAEAFAQRAHVVVRGA